MSCQEMRPLLHAFLDDELDPVRGLEVQQHLDRCPACAREHAAQRTLRAALRDEALYHRTPEGLATRARAALRAAGAATRGRDREDAADRAAPMARFRRLHWAWLPAGAAAALLMVVALALLRSVSTAPGPAADELLAREVTASHVRSLMPGHLTDVPSSDQHTVKPWFNGRLDFSPPVKDLAGVGFPLAGGRLDYLADRPVAALVYERRKHVINLMIWPAPHEPDRAPTLGMRQGYRLLHWTQGGMIFWAVSDLNEGELKEFVRAVRSE